MERLIDYLQLCFDREWVCPCKWFTAFSAERDMDFAHNLIICVSSATILWGTYIWPLVVKKDNNDTQRRQALE